MQLVRSRDRSRAGSGTSSRLGHWTSGLEPLSDGKVPLHAAGLASGVSHANETLGDGAGGGRVRTEGFSWFEVVSWDLVSWFGVSSGKGGGGNRLTPCFGHAFGVDGKGVGFEDFEEELDVWVSCLFAGGEDGAIWCEGGG